MPEDWLVPMNLQVLNLDSNQLTGTIPLGGVSSDVWFSRYLSDCEAL